MATDSFKKDSITDNSDQPIYTLTNDSSLANTLESNAIYAIQNRSNFLIYYSTVSISNVNVYKNTDGTINYDKWHELNPGDSIIFRHPVFDATTGEYTIITRGENSFGPIHLAISGND